MIEADVVLVVFSGTAWWIMVVVAVGQGGAGIAPC